MTMDPKDLAKRRHALRLRIRKDERDLAIAYPAEAARIAENLESERTQLAELDGHLEEAKDLVRQQMRNAAEAYFSARDTFVTLCGYYHDPGFRDQIFTKVSLRVEHAQDTLGLKAALLRATELEPAPEPEVSEAQRLHDESLRNQRAGRGFYSDRHLERIAENPVAAEHGFGARIVRPQKTVVESPWEGKS